MYSEHRRGHQKIVKKINRIKDRSLFWCYSFENPTRFPHNIYFHGLIKIFIYMKGILTEKERSSIGWFTFQMPTLAGTVLD